MIFVLQPDGWVANGGIQQAYVIVELLHELGVPVAMYHAGRNYEYRWFASDAPVVRGPTLDLDRGDILVVPEHAAHDSSRFFDTAPVVVLVQSFVNVFEGAGVHDDWTGEYPGVPNAVAALTMSVACDRFLAAATPTSFPRHRLPCVVDSDRFRPGRKTKTIAFMPRRNWADVQAVVQLLRRRPELDDWDLRPIDGLPHDEVARALGEAMIFLSFADREGFGLPAAEAISAGCYVVGYSGFGGREFMQPGWCSVMDGHDLVTFADEVVRAAQRVETDETGVTDSTAAGRRFIADRYNRARMAEGLAAAVESLTAERSPALQPRPVRIRHPSAAARARATRVKQQLVPRLTSALRSRRPG